MGIFSRKDIKPIEPPEPPKSAIIITKKGSYDETRETRTDYDRYDKYAEAYNKYVKLHAAYSIYMEEGPDAFDRKELPPPHVSVQVVSASTELVMRNGKR